MWAMIPILRVLSSEYSRATELLLVESETGTERSRVDLRVLDARNPLWPPPSAFWKVTGKPTRQALAGESREGAEVQSILLQPGPYVRFVISDSYSSLLMGR